MVALVLQTHNSDKSLACRRGGAVASDCLPEVPGELFASASLTCTTSLVKTALTTAMFRISEKKLLSGFGA